MKKRFLALALSLAMIFSVIPTDTITAKAEELNTISQETTEEYLAESAATSTDSDEAASVSDTQSDIDTLDETVADEITDETASVSDEVSEEETTETLANGSAVDATIEETAEETNNDTETTKTVCVYYSSNAVSLVGRVGSKAATSISDGATFYINYTINEGDSLTVVATACENSRITGATFVDGDKKSNLKASSATSCEFTVSPTEADSTLKINTVENNKAVLYQDSTLQTVKNNTYALSLDTAYTAKILHGDHENVIIKSATATVSGGKNDIFASIATLASNKESVTINVSRTSEYAGKTITLTLTDKNDKIYNYTLNIAPVITSISIAGVRADGTVTDTVGTKKTFKISANKGAELTGLTVSYQASTVKGVKTTSSDTTVSYSDGVLIINSGALEETGVITFEAYGNKIASYPVSITDNFKTIKPVITVVSSDDTSVTLKLSLPSNFKYENISSTVTPYYSFVYSTFEDYKSTADGDTSHMKYAYEKITGDSQTYTLTLLTNITNGNGYAQKFFLATQIGLNLNSSTDSNTEENLYDNYSKAVNSNVSTKNPAYETKLSLTKKRTTIYAGESNVVVATAKFSKATTYRTLSSVTFTDSNGGYYTSKISVELSDDKTEILATASDNVPLGKYIVTAYATQPSGAIEVTACMTITVAGDIQSNGSSITPSTYSVYKAPAKASTIKTTLNLRDYQYNTVKPASVTYSIHTSSSQIENKVTINNKGVITIPKDYVVGLDSTDTFWVAATITGKNGETTILTTEKITITSEGLDFGYIMINGQKEGSTVYANQLNESRVYVYDSNGNQIDSNNYSLSGTGCKVFYNGVGINRRITKCTITATAKDGSGLKHTATYIINNADGALTLSVDNDYGTINNTAKTLTVSRDRAPLDIYIDDMDICPADNVSISCQTGTIVTYAEMLAAYPSPTDSLVAAELEFEKKYNVKEVYYCPKAATDTITITKKSAKNGDKTVTYNVTNTVFSGDDANATLNTSLVAYYDASGYISTVSTPISGLDSSATYTYHVSFDESEYLKNYSKYSRCNALEMYYDETLTNNTITFGGSHSYNSDYSKPISGSIKMYIYLQKTKDGTTTDLKPIPITVNVQKVKSVTTSIASSATINSTSGSKTTSLTKSVKNGTISYTDVLNAYTDGTPNKFNQYFSISSDGIITAKKDLSSIAAKDLTGYVKYYLTNQIGEITIKTVKVTIKVNKTKTK